MSYCVHFSWLAKMSMSVLKDLWPITLALILLTGIATIKNLKPQAEGFGRFILLNLFPLLFTILILVAGTVFFDTERSNAGMGTALILILLVAHLPFCIYLTAKMPERGWFTVAFTLLEGWASVCAAFVALLSVANDWP